MLRVHAMLKVRDLDASIRFYRELFGTEPTKRRDGYAQWLIDEPRVNFSIGQAAGDATPGIEHLGIQAETPAELETLRRRIGRAAATMTSDRSAEGDAAANDPVWHEGETTCCYAQSDKSWIVDGQGVSWEAFYTHGESTTYAAASREVLKSDPVETASLCEPGCCSSGHDGPSAAERETAASAA